MRISLSWLEEFVDLKGKEPEEIAEALSLRSVEATVDTFGGEVEGAVFGRVIEVADHPEREDLAVLSVDLGPKGKVSLVTTDKEIRPGVMIPVATPGSRVKGRVVEKVPFGSVVSEGMALSPQDLCLDDAEEGVLKVEDPLDPGSDVGSVLGFGDPLLELDITPNRGDMLSVRGIARDLSALLNLPKIRRDVPRFDETGEVDIQILDQDCWRYRGVVIEGIEVKRSPLRIRRRLWQAGLKSINNVVDVTNYIMIQEGQPLHAFDLDRLEGGVIVRSARDGEKMRTIEGREVALDGTVLVIADAKKPVAIAGIVGGEETAVSVSTTRVLIEAAYFDPKRIRRGSKRLGIQTESSYRFERNVDIGWLDSSEDLAVSMILDLAGGDLVAVRDLYVKRYEPKRIFLQVGKFVRYSGGEFDPEEVGNILKALEIPHEIKRCGVEVFVPSHRMFDIGRDVDIIEEIMRVKGYESFPAEEVSLPSRSDYRRELTREIADFLRARGLREVINISYEEDSLYRTLGIEPPQVEIVNPLIPSQRFLRSTLVPSLLRTTLYNDSHYNFDLAVFEIGRVFTKEGEDLRVGILLKGRSRLYPYKEWDHTDLMTLVQGVVSLTGQEVVTVPSDEKFLHPHVQARVLKGDDQVGFLGRLHPSLEKDLGIKGTVFLAEISLGKLGTKEGVPKYAEVSRFPPVIRDLALVVDKNLPVGKLLNEIRSHMGSMVEEVTVFDLYTGEKVGEGKKSVGVRMVMRSREGSLSSEEVGSVIEDLVRRLRDRLGVEIR